jgi:nitrate reductase assembly molybdenum cofactor insertion protein NarJ
MDTNIAVRRAQVYSFLSDAFLYPDENWCEDVPLVEEILSSLDWVSPALAIRPLDLAALQAAYRHAFGATGSICYETEYGLPHEFRQSQELADINGFYRAFGFTNGGRVRERPDHLAVELEFMSILALKEAYTAQDGLVEHFEVCLEAQRKFLGDHLGRWIDKFAQSLALNGDGVARTGYGVARMGYGGPYQALARFCALFVNADAARLGVLLEPGELAGARPTPFDPDFSCAGCPVAEVGDRVLQRQE